MKYCPGDHDILAKVQPYWYDLWCTSLSPKRQNFSNQYREQFIHHLFSDALHNLVPFLQFKNRDKYPWRSVTFNKVQLATLLKVTLLHRCFSFFKIVRNVPNRAIYHIYFLSQVLLPSDNFTDYELPLTSCWTNFLVCKHVLPKSDFFMEKYF